MLQCTKIQLKYCIAQNAAGSFWNRYTSPQLAPLRQSMSGPKFPGENMFRNWMRLANDAVMLGLETQRVMGLRSPS